MSKKVLFILLIAGCGGMLYDFGGTIIAPAIPYFEAIKLFTADEISRLTAAVVLTAAFASLFAGTLAEKFGRKPSMLFAAALAAFACFPICLCDGNFWLFYAGRALQGIAAGLLGVIVPMYLAEALPASDRGKGAGVFQFMDVGGILFCSLVGLAVVKFVGAADSPDVSTASKVIAWKTIFWSSAAPAVLFFLGALGLDESPVWLAKRGKKGAAADAAESPAAPAPRHDSLFQRKYVYPFLLAVVILACHQATGINSMQYYALKMFQDAGLSNAAANVGFMVFTGMMLLMTVVACAFVDRKGRKFLLMLGTAGIIVSHLAAAGIFWHIEHSRSDVTSYVKTLVNDAKTLDVSVAAAVNQAADKDRFLAEGLVRDDTQLVLTYRQGGDIAQEIAEKQDGRLSIQPKPEAKDNTLEVVRAELGTRPSPSMGWLVVLALIAYISAFSIGPGVVVWLALSELMPDRIRANGMAIAMFINMMVAYYIADRLLSLALEYGYSPVLIGFACSTVIYFLTATFFLPETKGKTLAEIEAFFAKGK